MLARVVLAGLLVLTGVSCATPVGDRGPVRDHFDGERFHNDTPFDIGWTDLWRYFRERDPGPWVRNLTPSAWPPPPSRVAAGALRATVVNHATVLLQFDDLNVLTDPIWSARASPVSWAGPQRYVAPGIAFDALPPIDVVLISHNHYDHLDLPTLKRLDTEHQPLFVVGLGEDAWLREAGLRRVTALDWGQTLEIGQGLRLHAQRSQHWTGRRLFGADRNRSLWLAFVLETTGGPIYFAGDTGYAPHFAETGARFGPFRLALLPIGAYQPRWLTAYQHTSPTDAVQAHHDLRARFSMGVHFGTFQLSEEGQDQPAKDLRAARAEADLPDRAFIVPAFGQGYDIPAIGEAAPTAGVLP